MKCSEIDCYKQADKIGLCHMHYMRKWRSGSLPPRPEKPKFKCLVEDCDTLTSRKSGLCTDHYKQKWYLNKVGRTELIVRTSQERWIHTSYGYVMIKVDNKLVYEHRILAEKALGKPLPKGAVIHHTGKTGDNHGPFKLVICPNQEYHFLLHKRAKELGYESN